MNQFEMVAIIVVAVMFASIFKARYGYSRRQRGEGTEMSVEEKAETLRLRDEVKQLKDRIHVLERIAVDKEDTLSRQIEELRDR
ncbi:MAG: hypothetical protein ACJ8E8_07725 [Sphingomicrobium sp.]